MGRVAPETKILMANLRWVEAGNLHAGDQLLVVDAEPTRKISDGLARARYWRGTDLQTKQGLVCPCYEVALDDGTEFIASAEQRWLTKSKGTYRWLKTKDLLTSDCGKPSRLVRLLKIWQEHLSREAGYLAGAFDGNGYLIQKPSGVRCGFTHQNNAMTQYVDHCLAHRGFQSSEICGVPELLRFLGQIRPERLIEKFNPGQLGRLHDLAHPAVLRCAYIGEQVVVSLKTGTGAIIAEGLAAHN